MVELGNINVVVGVDGSSASAAAVRWAENYAHSTGASVRLVIAWHWPVSYGAPIAYDGFDPEADARKIVEAAAADLQLPTRQVSVHVVQGVAGDVLVHAAERADLLVVGSRGHGSLAAALVGSTSSYCVHHAPCSVVIVR